MNIGFNIHIYRTDSIDLANKRINMHETPFILFSSVVIYYRERDLSSVLNAMHIIPHFEG